MAQNGPPPQLAGWFTKKAEKLGKSQKRFFELQGNEIRYFARAVRHLNADRGADLKGNVMLSPGSTAQALGTKLTIVNPDRTWELLSDAPMQAQQWAAAINALFKPGRKGSVSTPAAPTTANSSPTAAAAATTTTTTATPSPTAASNRSPSVASNRGVRRESSLAPPPAAQPPPPPSHTASSASLTGAMGDRDDDDVPVGDGSGMWMLKKGEGLMARDQMRYFVLMSNRYTGTTSLAYFETVHGAQPMGRRGAIPISAESAVAARGPLIEIQNPDRLWVLTANTPEDAARFSTVLRRIAGARAATTTTATTTATAPLPSSSATQPNPAPTNSAVATSSSSTTSEARSLPLSAVSPQPGVFATREEAWPAAAAATTTDRRPWAAGAGGDGAEEAGPVERDTEVKTAARAAGVWLAKKGEGLGALTGEKRRYFVLLFGVDSRMLKFTYFADVQQGRPIDRKGFVPLTAESRVSSTGTHLTIDNPGRVWQLTAASADEAAHWARALSDAIEASNAVTPHTVSLAAGAGAGAAGDGDDEATLATQEAEEGVAAGLWLVKAGEGLGRDRRRWFALQKGLSSQTLRLTYYADQRGGVGVERKGCIALGAASTIGQDGKLVAISNPDRLWKLHADTPDEAATFAEVLRRALAPLQAAAASPTRAIAIGAVGGDTETDDVGVAELEKEVLGGAGAWFVKKGEGAGALTGGKKRYFVLRYGQNTNMLKFTYYADVLNGVPTDKKGFIPIGGLSTIYSQGKLLVIENPDRTWQLTADSTDEAATWVPMLIKARVTAAKWTSPDLVDSDDDEQVVVAEEEERAENGGEGAWFTKKGEGRLSKAKQRYFVLCTGQHTHGLRFVYYAGLRDGSPVSRIGGIALTKGTTVSTNDRLLTIINPDRTWELTASTAATATHWASVLKTAIATPRVFDEATVTTIARSTYDEKLAESETNIVLTPGRGGWFSKKGEGMGRDKLRYFVPTWGTKTGLLKFAYYAAVEGTTPRDQKGFVPLTADSAVAVQDDLLCIKNRDRLWQLSATQAADPSLWSRILSDALAEQSLSAARMPALARVELLVASHASQADVLKALEGEYGAAVRARYENELKDRFADESESTGEVRDDYDDIELHPGKGVWLAKRGEGLGLLSGDKRRYFVLVRRDATRTLWFNYYAAFANSRPTDLKGSIEILPSSRVSANGAELSIANTERLWRLTAPTPDEAAQWGRLLTAEIAQQYPTGEVPKLEEETALPGLGVWLLKKGEGLGALTGPKRRYFTLARGVQSGLVKMAYAETEGGVAKGAILLSPMSHLTSNDRALQIENPDRVWELTADSPTEAARVAEVLNAALGSHAAGITVAAAADEEVLPGLHVWLQKKGEGLGAIRDKWRFFVLSWRRASQTLLVSYYESADGGVGVDRKGTVAINASSVIGSSGKKITIENPDRVWELTARSQTIAAQIAATLHNNIQTKYTSHDERTTSTGDEIDVCPGSGVWLRKKGEGVGALTGDKKRYFVLLFAQHTRTLRMAYYSELVGTQPLDRRGAIPVSSLSTLQARGAELRIDNPDRTWLLTADSELLAGQWAEQLRRAIQEQKENSTTNMPLLARLQQLLHTEYISTDVDVADVTARLKMEFSDAIVASRADDIAKAVTLFEGTDPTRKLTDEDNEEDVLPGKGVWLAKRGEGAGVLTGSKKRYFVLVRGAMSRLLRFNYYAAFRNGTPSDSKGAIELFPGTKCEASSTLLTIDTGNRLWQLTAANTAEAVEWQQLLTANIDAAYPGGVLPDTAEESTVDLPLLNLWLLKKGEGLGALTGEKRRYFVLQRVVGSGSLRIAYFAPDTSGQPTALKGKIILYPTTTVEAVDNAIVLTNEGRVWRLTASSPTEAMGAVARLQGALDEAYPRTAALPSYEAEDLETETELALSRAAGVWLVKKGEGLGAGEKRRLFVPMYGRTTRALKLNYYAECNAGLPSDKKGSIVLTPFSDITAISTNIAIKNPDRTWQLTAVSSEEAAGWVGAMRGLVAECRSSPQHIPLLARLQSLLADCDGASETGAVRDTLAAEYGADMVNLYSDDIDEAFARLLREDSASSLGSATSTLSVVSVTGDDDEEELLGGEGVWLTKKGEGIGLFSDKKRYFVLRWGVQSQRLKFAYFEGLKKGAPHKRKGAVVVVPSTMINANGKALTLEVAGERVWHLTASTTDEAQRWAAILVEHVKQRYPDGELQTSARDDDEDEEEIPGVGLWLYKRGEGLGALARDKKRYFTLLWGAQSQQLKLCYHASLQHGHPVNRKGFIAISPRSVIEAAGKAISLVNPDRTWHLSAESAREAGELVQVLKTVAKEKFPNDNDTVMADGSEAEVDLLPGRGAFFVKKAEKLMSRDQHRYFTLAFGLATRSLRFAYYSEVKDRVPLGRKGHIPVSMLTTFRTSGTVLTVENPDRKWTLTADVEDEIAPLIESCRRCLGEQRADVNNNMPLLARLYTAIAELVELDQPVSAELLREMLTREYGKGMVDLYGETIDYAAQDSSNHRLPGAWFSKKADGIGKDRRRFFELGARDIKYFSDCENGRGVHQKGTISLFPTTLVLQSGVELILENPDRKWALVAENARIASRWMRAISLLLKKVFGTELPDDFDTDDNKGVPLKAAWFSKKEDDGTQQRRWIVLMADMSSVATTTSVAALAALGASAGPPAPDTDTDLRGGVDASAPLASAHSFAGPVVRLPPPSSGPASPSSGPASPLFGPNTPLTATLPLGGAASALGAGDSSPPPSYVTQPPRVPDPVAARILCFRTVRGTTGEELLGKIVLGPTTAVSYGDNKLLIKSDKKTWELYAADDNMALEWARELRSLRNGVLQSSPLYIEYLQRLETLEREQAQDEMRIAQLVEDNAARIHREQAERLLSDEARAAAAAAAAAAAESPTGVLPSTADTGACVTTDGVVVETALDAHKLSPLTTIAAAAAPSSLSIASADRDKKKKKSKKRSCLFCF